MVTPPQHDSYPLSDILAAVEAGKHLPPDGSVTVVGQSSGREAAVLAFTARFVVVADVDPAWVRAQLPPGDLSAPLNPPFLTALSQKLGRRVNNVDLVSVAEPLSGAPPLPLTPVDDRNHPRVVRALRYRDDVRVWQAEGGVVLLGRGLGGRWEAAVEVDPAYQGRGLGRALASAARHLVPDDRALWVQVAPGNAASVRAFHAAGYRPVGAEALLVH